MLYFRMFISMSISIYTSRIVLHQLGIDDYGVYNVVGGIVSLISFINSSMTGATTRFLSYEQENKDQIRLKKTFGSSLIIHLIIGFTVILLLETIGLWFLNNYIKIPSESRNIASYIYQFSVFSTFINIIKVPFSAATIAHEKMKIYALIEISLSLLNLATALILILIHKDKLLLYGGMMLLNNLIIFLLYAIYTTQKFQECHIKIKTDKRMFKPMFHFFGWDLYGNLSTVARGQGVNMLLNIFFGVVANTAYGISNQVQSAVGAFSSNIITAVKPQIIKSYASGDIARCTQLIIASSKLICVLLLLISLPLIMEMHDVLYLWLGEVPKYTVWFARFTIGFLFFAALSGVVVTGVHATGNIKRPSFINGTLYLLVIPITYIAFRLNSNIYLPFILNIIFVFIGCLVNITTIKQKIPMMTIKLYFNEVLAPGLLTGLLTFLIINYVHIQISNSIIRGFAVILTSSFFIIIFSYFIIATKQERVQTLSFLKKHFNKNADY